MTAEHSSRRYGSTTTCTASGAAHAAGIPAAIDYDLLLGMLWDTQIDLLDARIIHGISNGMTRREVARHLKVDEGTVRHRLKRFRTISGSFLNKTS